MFLLDLGRRAGAELGRRSGRLVFRERFRLFLRRQFPEWKLAELSAEAEPGAQPLAGLSARLPAPRPARLGRHRLPAGGRRRRRCSRSRLIWLDYLRARERRVAVEGLAIYVPAGRERSAALRLLCLDPDDRALRALHVHRGRRHRARRSARSRQSRYAPGALPPPRAQPAPSRGAPSPRCPAWSAIAKHDGRVSLRVRGIEFARDRRRRAALRPRRAAAGASASPAEIERLVAELDAAPRVGPRASALPAVSRRLAGIAGARADRDARRLAAARAGLRPGAGVHRRRARRPRSAGGRSHRPAGGHRAEGHGRSAPAAAGAGLLDACQVAPGPRRVLGVRLLSRASRCGPIRRACCWSRHALDFHPTTETISEFFLTPRRCGANRAGGRMAEGAARDVSPSPARSGPSDLLC